MWRLSILVAVLVAAGQTPGLALAQELDLSGSVAAEVRLFLAEGRFEGQLQSFQGSRQIFRQNTVVI